MSNSFETPYRFTEPAHEQHLNSIQITSILNASLSPFSNLGYLYIFQVGVLITFRGFFFCPQLSIFVT